MSKKQAELSSWVFPIILYFVFPEVGTYFIIIKIVFSVFKGLKKRSSVTRDSYTERRESQFNETKPHDIDFSHDHNFNNNASSRLKNNYSKTQTFETEMNARCPICNANNFVKQIPSECEYCGSRIEKI